jgi:tetratricopeptide (TPR) repeat protein
MTTFSDFKYLCGVLACAAALTGCATDAPVKPVGPLPLADLLSQGSQQAATGQKEKAIAVWKQASNAYPGDKTPWANIAQSRYESGQYGEAITSAQEVLLRDPNDKAANAIIAVAGLRLANRALGDLSRQNGMTPQVRADSQEQVKQLREYMADAPAVVPQTRPRIAEPRPVRPPKDANPLKDLDKAPTKTVREPESKGSSPFDVLTK